MTQLLGLPLVVAFIWLQALGGFASYPVADMPPGQISYLAAKLLGLFAIVFLWMQISVGLLRRIDTKAQRIPIVFHKSLGLLTAGVIATHISSYFIAVWQRTQAFPVGLLFPQPFDYYHTAIALGQFAVTVLVRALDMAASLVAGGFCLSVDAQLHDRQRDALACDAVDILADALYPWGCYSQCVRMQAGAKIECIATVVWP